MSETSHSGVLPMRLFPALAGLLAVDYTIILLTRRRLRREIGGRT